MTKTALHAPHPFRPPADLSRFFVVTPISNPIRFDRRFELYWRFAEMCEDSGVQLITVEQAFGLRPFMVTGADNRMHVQVRTVEELWHKENMLNIGIKRAAEMGAREVAWVDSDCRPAMLPRAWYEETWHQLQHYEFVQMFEWLIDMSLNYNPIGTPQPSFMSNYIKNGSPDLEDFIKLNGGPSPYPYYYGGKRVHPGLSGLAWAANVETGLNRVGGLIDYSILGAGDWYMAHGLVGKMRVLHAKPTGALVRKLFQWQELCERWIKRDVGFVRGTLYHDFHGRKELRGYNTRGSILTDNAFDPDLDIKYDAQGLLQLETWEPRQIRLRDQIRAYFRARNEDSTTGGED